MKSRAIDVLEEVECGLGIVATDIAHQSVEDTARQFGKSPVAQKEVGQRDLVAGHSNFRYEAICVQERKRDRAAR